MLLSENSHAHERSLPEMEPLPVTDRSGLTGLDRYRYQSSKIQTGSISAHYRSFLDECELYPYLSQKYSIRKNLLDYMWIIIINNSNGGIIFIIRYSWISTHSKQNEYQDIDN
jgi:hypothetical protein